MNICKCKHAIMTGGGETGGEDSCPFIKERSFSFLAKMDSFLLEMK